MSSTKNNELREKSSQLLDLVEKMKKTVDDSDSIEDEPPKTKKPKLSVGASFNSNNNNNKDDDATYVPTFISTENLPPKEMTGVSPFFTQLCATICARLCNDKNNIEEFNDLVPKEYYEPGYDLEAVGLSPTNPPETVQIIKFCSNGMFAITNSPFVIMVTGTTMIIGFRGSHGLVDAIRDINFQPGSSFRWGKVGKVVKVFSGTISYIDNFMVDNEQLILNTIKERNITELILTGHSLGGGIAQVGHLWLVGSMNEEYHTPQSYKPWEELNGKLTVRTVAFEAPMTTAYLQHGLNNEVVAVDEDGYDVATKGREFIVKCGATMCTTCFAWDVIPRLGGYFEEWALGTITSTLALKHPFGKGSFLHPITGAKYRFLEYLLHKVAKSDAVDEKLSPLLSPVFDCAKAYQHIGKIIYYESADSVPQVHINDVPENGLLISDSFGPSSSSSSSSSSPPPQFGDIGFAFPETVETFDDVINWILENHMFPVCGPGLTFTNQPYFIDEMRP